MKTTFEKRRKRLRSLWLALSSIAVLTVVFLFSVGRQTGDPAVKLERLRQSAHAQNVRTDPKRAFDLATLCGSMIGKASACGINVENIARRCGQKIDSLTEGDAQGRTAALQQIIVSAELSMNFQKRGGVESCSKLDSAYTALERDLQ